MKLQEIRDKYVSRELSNDQTFKELRKTGMGYSPANQLIQLWIVDEVAKLTRIKWGGR